MSSQGIAPVGAMASGPTKEGGQSKVLAGLAHRVFTINFGGTFLRLTFMLAFFFLLVHVTSFCFFFQEV